MAKSELLCKDQRSHIHRVNTAKVTSRPNLNVNSGTAISSSFFFPALLCVVCLHSYFNTRNSPKIDKNMFCWWRWHLKMWLRVLSSFCSKRKKKYTIITTWSFMQHWAQQRSHGIRLPKNFDKIENKVQVDG